MSYVYMFLINAAEWGRYICFDPLLRHGCHGYQDMIFVEKLKTMALMVQIDNLLSIIYILFYI